MSKVCVFPLIRQARFAPKRTAMKYLYFSSVERNAVRAAEMLADAEAEIGAALEGEGVPASDRRAALDRFRADVSEMVRRNGGHLPERKAR